jgi:hypothetical protein
LRVFALRIIEKSTWARQCTMHPLSSFEAPAQEMRESKSKPDRGIINTRVLLRNQRRETALECTSHIFVARRPPNVNAPTPS